VNFEEKIVDLLKEIKVLWKLEQEIREQTINNDVVERLLKKLDLLRKGSD
jgi:hypothetical protein